MTRVSDSWSVTLHQMTCYYPRPSVGRAKHRIGRELSQAPLQVPGGLTVGGHCTGPPLFTPMTPKPAATGEESRGELGLRVGSPSSVHPRCGGGLFCHVLTSTCAEQGAFSAPSLQEGTTHVEVTAPTARAPAGLAWPQPGSDTRALSGQPKTCNSNPQM